LNAINAHDILLAMRTGGGQELPCSNPPELTEIYGEFARIEQAEREAATQVSLLALAQPQPSPALVAAPPAAAPDPKKMATAAAPSPEVVVEPMVETPVTPFPEDTSDPAPAPLPAHETAKAEEPPRRESARPAENMDFPL
jgi:DNA polymerase-3 subunit gamma/tau